MTIIFTPFLPTSVTLVIGKGDLASVVNNMTSGQDGDMYTCILFWA